MENSLAIIILNYCNYKLTEECVNNLIKLNIQSKIIIVDNNSKNESYEYLSKAFYKYEDISVIKNNVNSGYAAGNNVGIRYAIEQYKDIKYIAIMNPDVVLSYREVLTNLMKKLDENDDIAVISALMIYKNTVNFEGAYWNIPTSAEVVFEHFQWTRSIFNKRNHERMGTVADWNGVARVGVVPGSFFIIKSDILIEIGLLDEGTFLYNEENILAINLKRKGYTEALSVGDFYIHNHNPSAKQKTLKQWINVLKTGYDSRKYLCDTYYNSKFLSFLLAFVEKINYIDNILRYMGSKVKRKLKGNK